MAKNKLQLVFFLSLLIWSCNQDGRFVDKRNFEKTSQESQYIDSQSGNITKNDSSSQSPLEETCRNQVKSYLIARQNTFSELVDISDETSKCFNILFPLKYPNKLVYLFGFKDGSNFIHCLSSKTDSTEIYFMTSWDQSMTLIDTFSVIRRVLIDNQWLFRRQIKWHPVDSSYTKFYVEEYSFESAKTLEHPDMMKVDSVSEYYINNNGIIELMNK
jgi:hypothetical protein